MTLEEYCNSISENNRITITIELCERALPIWQIFASDKRNLGYQDSVVELYHKVRPQLLADSIKCCKSKPTNFISRFFKGFQIKKLLEEFSDPVVSMQDLDWELPKPVESIFYSVYYLLRGFKTTDKSSKDFQIISINQAIEALEVSNTLTELEIRNIIYKRNTSPNYV